MNFAKYLKRKKAQSTVEYLLLAAVVMALLAISVSPVMTTMQTSAMDDFYKAAAKGILGE